MLMRVGAKGFFVWIFVKLRDFIKVDFVRICERIFKHSSLRASEASVAIHSFIVGDFCGVFEFCHT